MAARRKWRGLESIEEGDRISWRTPTGVTMTATVQGIVGIKVSDTFGVYLDFYSDVAKWGENRTPVFQRAVAESWITHWNRRRVSHPVSAGADVGVTSDSARKQQLELRL